MRAGDLYGAPMALPMRSPYTHPPTTGFPTVSVVVRAKLSSLPLPGAALPPVRAKRSHSGKALIRNFCNVHYNRQGRVSPGMKVQACGSRGNLTGTSDRLQRLGKVYGRRESEPICGRRISESCRKLCSLKTGG